MRPISRKTLGIVATSIVLAWTSPSHAEELSSAIAGGRVSVTIRGNGGSSGDAVELVVTKTAAAASGTLRLTIAPGTRLQSGDPAAQSMVVATVRGRMVDNSSFEPSGVIEVHGDESVTYVLEAYCLEFEKENPSTDTGFTVGAPDPVLACILEGAGSLSTEAKQAAVWIYTDHVSFEHVNEKFNVSRADWSAAERVLKNCTSLARP